jgi:hypothetical protein
MKATKLLEELESKEAPEKEEKEGTFEMQNCDAGCMFLHCALEVQAQARVFHLMTHSFAQHKAMQELYESMSDFQDTFMETYIGAYGRPKIMTEIYLCECKDMNSPIEYVKAKRQDFVNMYTMIEHRGLINLMDEIISMLDKIIYLLSLS